MAANSSTFKAMAILRGVEEIPPVKTPASACLMTKLSKHGLDYQLETDQVSDVTSLKLHLGIRSQTGAAVADLTNNLYKGTLTDDDFINSMQDLPLDILLKEIERGHLYVNLYTKEHPEGFLRGQLELTQMETPMDAPAPKMPKAADVSKTHKDPKIPAPQVDDDNFVGIDVSKINFDDIFGRKPSKSTNYMGGGSRNGAGKGSNVDLSSFAAEMAGDSMGGGLNDFMSGAPGGMHQSRPPGFKQGPPGANFDDYMTEGRHVPVRGGHRGHMHGPPSGHERRGYHPGRGRPRPPHAHKHRKHRKH